jgi:hypothetical protein
MMKLWQYQNQGLKLPEPLIRIHHNLMLIRVEIIIYNRIYLKYLVSPHQLKVTQLCTRRKPKEGGEMVDMELVMLLRSLIMVLLMILS